MSVDVTESEISTRGGERKRVALFPVASAKIPERLAKESAENVESMIAELESMRHSTEHAALEIGSLLERIVSLATQGNTDVKQTIFEALGDSASDDAESINDVVVRQLDNLNQFVSQSSSFLSRQVELAQQAHEACMTISKSAQNVAQLTKTSQVLSINLRIEAARLGNKGSSFTALGQEVHAFSSAVLLAANEITESASSFSATIPEMRDQAVQMEEEMSALSDTFHSELSMLSQRTSKMQSSLETTLDQVEVTNSQILDCSNQTLGHLAFQDPVSQGIQRVQHNIQQMQSLVEGERVDFVSLASIKEDVGEDGRTEREAGEVDLF